MTNIAYTSRLSMVLPEELRLLKQFILWCSVPNKDGKPTKVPYRCVGGKASTTDPNTWSEFGFALECMRKADWATGIGFVFTAEDPYCGIDLDNIWRSDADEGTLWAIDIMERFSDTYGEASPSDTGYKIWCKAKLPHAVKRNVGTGGIEIYDQKRFFTVTGDSNKVSVIADHQTDIDALVAKYSPAPLTAGIDAFSQAPHIRLDPSIAAGKRHPSLVSICGTLRKRNVCSEAIAACLLAMNAYQCQGKYSSEHIEQIVRSSEKWQQENSQTTPQ